jgi:hypothetical protein
MAVITTLKEKREEKQMKYERKMLRELSHEEIKKIINEHFHPYFKVGLPFLSAIEEGCVDIAIETYLLGAEYSKFGHYGETIEQAEERCKQEIKNYTDALYDFVTYWGHIGDNDLLNESLYYSCEHFVHIWWHEGFRKGEKRYKLRLH